ncbi:MAG: PstS family phosphate ABC transporter substrate-binding protein [Bacteroidia bacterium]
MRYLGGLAALWLISCTPTPQETLTTGHIRIAVDESLRPAVEAALQVFHERYKYAHIQALYVGEAEALTLLLQDSVRLAIVPRDFTPEEKKLLEEEKILPKSLHIATEGIACIAHPLEKDTALSVDQLRQRLVDGVGGYTFYLARRQSSLVRFVTEVFGPPTALKAPLYVLDSTPAVIHQIQHQPRSYGFIGVGWISDRDDSTANQFISSVRVLAIAPNDTSPSYLPFMAWLHAGYYPFSRKVYALSREPFKGLGTGFMSFLASSVGQRIFLKHDILPATMPIRLVEMRPSADWEKELQSLIR